MEFDKNLNDARFKEYWSMTSEESKGGSLLQNVASGCKFVCLLLMGVISLTLCGTFLSYREMNELNLKKMTMMQYSKVVMQN